MPLSVRTATGDALTGVLAASCEAGAALADRCANRHKVIEAVPAGELPDGEDRTANRARREHRSDVGAVLESRIQQRLCARNLVSARSCELAQTDVLNDDVHVVRGRDRDFHLQVSRHLFTAL
jgi:hypothetical protein